MLGYSLFRNPNNFLNLLKLPFYRFFKQMTNTLGEVFALRALLGGYPTDLDERRTKKVKERCRFSKYAKGGPTVWVAAYGHRAWRGMGKTPVEKVVPK